VSTADTTKTNASNNNNSVPATVAPPTAGFKITNEASTAAVWEALILKFENTSENAVSYSWDFGNGVTSTEKLPANFYYGTCGLTNTITLTVKNSAGQTATISAPYTVFCSRGMNLSGRMMPLAPHDDH
jgi:PKD repeat protein